MESPANPSVRDGTDHDSTSNNAGFPDHNLTTHEIDVLRILNGEDVEGWVWGAAMSACCSALKGRGYAKGMCEISDKGRTLLAEIDRLSGGEG